MQFIGVIWHICNIRGSFDK